MNDVQFGEDEENWYWGLKDKNNVRKNLYAV